MKNCAITVIFCSSLSLTIGNRTIHIFIYIFFNLDEKKKEMEKKLIFVWPTKILHHTMKIAHTSTSSSQSFYSISNYITYGRCSTDSSFVHFFFCFFRLLNFSVPTSYRNHDYYIWTMHIFFFRFITVYSFFLLIINENIEIYTLALWS